jgi:hypothetical protein
MTTKSVLNSSVCASTMVNYVPVVVTGIHGLCSHGPRLGLPVVHVTTLLQTDHQVT